MLFCTFGSGVLHVWRDLWQCCTFYFFGAFKYLLVLVLRPGLHHPHYQPKPRLRAHGMSLYIAEAVISSDANSFEESNVFESFANADFLIAGKCSWETEKSAVPSRVTLKKRSACGTS